LRIWLISPGLLLANELYGIIYADLCPGNRVDEAFFRHDPWGRAPTQVRVRAIAESLGAGLVGGSSQGAARFGVRVVHGRAR